MFFLNREKNQNINEAEFYIRTLHAEELKQVISSIREYVKADNPGAKVDITKVDNLFEQLFKDNDVPLVVYLSGESRRGGPELDSVNTFIEYLDSIMPTLQLDKPSTSERIVVEILPDRLALYKVNQGALINVLEKNISKMNIGKLNAGSRYVPIVITGEEKTILDIIRSSFVSNSDQLDTVFSDSRNRRCIDHFRIYTHLYCFEYIPTGQIHSSCNLKSQIDIGFRSRYQSMHHLCHMAAGQIMGLQQIPV